MKIHKRGFTLLEILMATVLLSYIFLIIGMFVVNTNSFQSNTNTASMAQNEASFAMEHIIKNLASSVSVTSPAKGTTSTSADFNTSTSDASPFDQSAIKNHRYYRVGNNLMYGSASQTETIARNITSLTLSRTSSSRVSIIIKADVNSAIVTLTSGVTPRCMAYN